MRFAHILSAVTIASADVVIERPQGHLHPSALLQLVLKDDPAALAHVRDEAKAKFLHLMHDAEERVHKDPKVLKAEADLEAKHAKYVADTEKTNHMLNDIKHRLAEGKAHLAIQDASLAREAAEIKRFTEERNKKLQEDERALMKLQKQRISSFAELPVDVSSFAQVKLPYDGSKAQQEIHAAEKALHELSDSIKKRVESLTQQLNTPGHQFKGEIIV
jgi:cytochrome c556